MSEMSNIDSAAQTHYDPRIEARVAALDGGASAEFADTVAGDAASMAQTLVAPDGLSTEAGAVPPGFDATIADGPPSFSAPGATTRPPEASPSRVDVRTTILPKVELGGAHGRLAFKRESRLRYEPTRELGSGGMGDVLLAADHDIDRKVAMKRLKPRLQQSSAMMRFVEEIRTVGKLEHPNIIPIHDVGVDDNGAYFFIMKHVDGEPLDVIIERLAKGDAEAHARYTFEVRAQIMLDILNAVSFAHAHGIIHRDIKPANVMIGPYGEVVVMDWGLAKPIHAPEIPLDEATTEDVEAIAQGDSVARLKLTRHGEVLGTPAYMAPEQAEGRIAELDERTDIYALGALFYELMTLRHYLDIESKESLVAMLHGVINDEPVFAAFVPQSHQTPVPAEFSHVIQRALPKAPDARYPSVKAMIDDLQRAMAGEFQVQCPVTLTKRGLHKGLRFVDRYPMQLVSIAIVSAALFMAMFGLAIFGLVKLVA